MSVENLVKDLSGLSVLNLVDLIKELEEKWDVKASAPVAANAGSAAGSNVAVAEKTEFSVVLVSAPDKIPAIKVVKELLNISLTEAKALVDKCSTLKDKVGKAEAEDFKKKLEAVGAKVELK